MTTPPGERLRLTSHSTLQAMAGRVWCWTGRFGRAAQALWLAAEPPSVVEPAIELGCLSHRSRPAPPG